MVYKCWATWQRDLIVLCLGKTKLAKKLKAFPKKTHVGFTYNVPENAIVCWGNVTTKESKDINKALLTNIPKSYLNFMGLGR